MPIIFDTLAEFRAFCRSFKLEGAETGKTGRARAKKAKSVTIGKAKAAKPGRKPGRKAAVKAVAAKRGPKPKKAAAVKKAAPKRVKPQGDTLTSKIRATIDSFLQGNRSFTANDVYDDLSRRDPSVNKQSVITSVLKQMNGHYKQISVTERPGNGPRAVKLYNAPR